jgi:hypothetical protein
VRFIEDCVYEIHKYHKGRISWSSNEEGWKRQTIRANFSHQLLKTKFQLDADDVESIAKAFDKYPMYGHTNILHWPVHLLLIQIEKQFGEKPLPEKLKETLSFLKEKIAIIPANHQAKEIIKINAKIDALFFQDKQGKEAVKPTFFPSEDEFAIWANERIRNLPEADRLLWFKLMVKSEKANGSKPSKKFLDECKSIFQEFGTDKFKKEVNEWFAFLVAMKDSTRHFTTQHGDRTFDHAVTEYLSIGNIEMIKAFVWMTVHFHDKNTLFNIASLAERCYKKIPNKGPAAAAVGNACLFVLANSKGMDGLGHLSRLKLRIKQHVTQKLIEKYLTEAADNLGVTIYEVEDMAVDDYGLENGKKEFEFNGWKAVAQIENIGKVSLNWFKPSGEPQKSEPAAVKTDSAAKLKKLKALVKQVELTTTAQRDRLDRMLKLNREISWEKFNEFYLSHGLMSFLTKRLIWTLKNNVNSEPAFFLDGYWVKNTGESISIQPDDTTVVSLWHPVFSNVDEISRWRAFMVEHQIVQPLKQAYREIYLLTDAELNTRSYSNRMAAHILKQHQFNSLAKTRGWKYLLMGNFDNGNNGRASIQLGEYSLQAEFWVNEVMVENAINDTGIWLYIATDQVRFINSTTNDVINLIDVPRIIFSEVMRDVDLFVGVASVGNDPTWADSGGSPTFRDYWQSYSFGDLSEIAKTRKAILENLIPRLKIAPAVNIKDRFLIVKGKLRTYKIHMGSTNILMEPNDQYLCIVPDRAKNVSDNLFLPFEGDSGLSIILSKALLLANDDKITDVTITRQIKHQ